MASAVLVTGAAGFVGSHLLELLTQDGTEIVAWQRPGTAPLVTATGVGWVTVEMHDRNEVAAAIHDARPSAVYHLAGVPHVGDSWSHTRETFAGNVLATHHLFEALRRAALAPRVLVTSSATVYAPADRALREDDEVLPNSPYGTSKLAQEMVAVRAWQDDGIPGLIVGPSITSDRGRHRRSWHRALPGRLPPLKPDNSSRCSRSAISSRSATSWTSATRCAPTAR